MRWLMHANIHLFIYVGYIECESPSRDVDDPLLTMQLFSEHTNHPQTHTDTPHPLKAQPYVAALPIQIDSQTI